MTSTITPYEDGPLIIRGDFELRGPDGELIEPGRATVALCRWWKATDRKRRERVRFIPLIAAGFWGTVFLFLWPHEGALMWAGVSVLVIAMVAIQVASPWAGPPVAKPRA